MRPQQAQPKIELSRLRYIGWMLWDPIGLMPPGQTWDQEASRYFADEYDTYLLQAAGLIRRGAPDSEVVDYLVMIETEHMGLGSGHGVKERAANVVAAIHADDQLWTWPEIGSN